MFGIADNNKSIFVPVLNVNVKRHHSRSWKEVIDESSSKYFEKYFYCDVFG